MAVALYALGLVLIVEGLAYALAPQLIEQMLDTLRRLSLDNRRLTGLVALAAGTALVWIARASGLG